MKLILKTHLMPPTLRIIRFSPSISTVLQLIAAIPSTYTSSSVSVFGTLIRFDDSAKKKARARRERKEKFYLFSLTLAFCSLFMFLNLMQKTFTVMTEAAIFNVNNVFIYIALKLLFFPSAYLANSISIYTNSLHDTFINFFSLFFSLFCLLFIQVHTSTFFFFFFFFCIL